MRKLLLTLGLSCFVVTSSHGMMHLYEKVKRNGSLKDFSTAFGKITETVTPFLEQVAKTICPVQERDAAHNPAYQGFNFSEDSAPIYACCFCWCRQFFCDEFRTTLVDLFRRGKFLKKDW